MTLIDVSGLAKSYGPTCLLGEVSFSLGEQERVGLVGRNGCGKSTLFRLLAGFEEPDGGRVVRRRGLTVGYLPQRPALDETATVRAVLEGHLGEARDKLRRHAELANALPAAGEAEAARLLAEQQGVHGWLDHHQAWTLDHRVDEICTRFAIENPDAVVGSLSGGWGQRVALAGMLLARPDVLLLDEPTNQLDAETVEWLEDHLGAYPGAVLLVTHDRYFLDRVVSRMFELEDGRLTPYTGGYSAYLEQKAERLALDQRTQTRLLNLLRREEEWLARGAKARSTKQKARIDRVEDLRDRKAGAPRKELDLSFAPDRALVGGGTVVEACGLTVEIGGNVVVRTLDFALRKGERVGILGTNGCGKTSLVRALVGELPPAGGTVNLGKHTQVSYLDQARTGLDDTLRVDEVLGEGDWVLVGGRDGQKRHKAAYLEDFLFSREDHKRPVSTLSGGERARLLLAKLLLRGANVLVLDEPTNDLDLPTLQVLDEALAAFAGCVLVVTHDRYFLDRVATGILHFEGDGRVVHYEGNYELFSRLRAQRKTALRPAPKAQAARTEPAAAPKSKTALTYREKQELETVEREVQQAEEQKQRLETALANPAALVGGRREIQQLSEELSTLEERLEGLLTRWEELEARR